MDIRWKPSQIPRVFVGSGDFLQVCNTLIHRFKSGLRLLWKVEEMLEIQRFLHFLCTQKLITFDYTCYVSKISVMLWLEQKWLLKETLKRQ